MRGRDPESRELERYLKADEVSLLSHLRHPIFCRLNGTCLRAGRGDHWSGGQGGDDVSGSGTRAAESKDRPSSKLVAAVDTFVGTIARVWKWKVGSETVACCSALGQGLIRTGSHMASDMLGARKGRATDGAPVVSGHGG